jgi:uncharacterized protein (DUF849 family)
VTHETEAGPVRPYAPLIINAAVTGIVPSREDTPHLPASEEEILADGLACVEAGASILHIHARDEAGRPSMEAERYARIIEGLRKERPEAVVCVTTSGRMEPGFEARAAVLDLDGAAKPDMASLTLSSMNFPRQAVLNPPDTVMGLAERMREKGVKPELEVFDTGMVNAFRYLWRKGLIGPPFYMNLILGSIYAAQAGMRDLVHMVGMLPEEVVWAAGGVGVSQLRVNAAAVLMGGHVRVGLEDNIWYDEAKKELTTNVRSIRRILRIAAELGREIASPDRTREMLGLGARR